MDTSNSKDLTKSSEVAASLKKEGQAAVNNVKNKLSDTSESVAKAGAEIAGEHANAAKSEITGQADQAHEALTDIAGTVSEHNETLGHFTTELADGLQEFNHRIKTKSLDDLASDAKRLATDNPALFILGAITVGAIGARFFRASAENNQHAGETPSSRSYNSTGLPTTSDSMTENAGSLRNGAMRRSNV